MPSKRAAKATTSNSSKRAKITGHLSVANDTASELASSRQTSTLTTNTPLIPLPFGVPPAWAEKKQQLCEALHSWFNTYQAGVYRKDGYAYGMLLDGGFAPRDKLNEESAITRAGGCRIKGKDGAYKQGKDQDNGDSVVQALMNSMQARMPIGVIAGSKNPNVPSKMPHRFNVLAFFFITDVWCEKLNGHATYMVRLQKIDLTSKSWWAPVTSGPLPMSATLEPVSPKAQACYHCQNSSPEIFQQGWTCLQWNCEAHFKFFAVAGDGVEIHVSDDTLDYNEAFLNKRHIWEMPSIPNWNFPALAPPIPNDEDRTHLGQFGYEQICKYGIVCPQCKSCIRRIFFDRWECETDGCAFVHRVKQYAVSTEIACIGGAKPIKVLCHELIKTIKIDLGKFKVTIYELPDELGEIIGRIYHLKPDRSLNDRDDGADALFGEIQTANLGLKRNPVKNKGDANEQLTAHWAANWGAPYKFVARQISKPFSETPEVILKAVTQMIWAVESLDLGADEPFRGFNECLSVGYFGNAHMSYHDDGEKELGPTVASLSLGCASTMQFRPKKKVNIGPAAKNMKMEKLSMLNIRQEHGDILVQHGAKIQKLYEHRLEPHGTLRFALTCRFIRPETLPTPADREYALTAGSFPDSHKSYVYDGGMSVGDI